jgi:hypothetical protein
MALIDWITDETETEEVDRARQFSEWWDSYEGRHPRYLPVTPQTGGRPEIDDNVVYNASGLTVDKGVSFLFGGLDQEVNVSLEEEEEESPTEEWLDGVFTANSKITLFQNLATNGGVCGHVWLRLYPEGAGPEKDQPRLVNLDPSFCSAYWAPDDLGVLFGYKIQFSMGDAARRTLIEPNGDDVINPQSWLVTDQIAHGTGDSSRKAVWEDMGEPVVWPYPFAPLLEAQNLPKPNEFYGRSDLEGGVVDLNDSMNRALSVIQRILRLHGHPRPWTAGVDPEQIQLLVQGPDRIITLPAEAQLNQLEMNAQGLVAAIEFLRQLKSAFHEVAKNPQVDPEKLGAIGGLSGVALRILYQPLLEKTGVKRGTYGDFLTELVRRLLILGSFEELSSTIHWPDPIPVNEKEDLEAATLKKALGVSWETVMESIGEDPELERERKENDPVSPITVMGLEANRDFNAGADEGGNEEEEEEE